MTGTGSSPLDAAVEALEGAQHVVVVTGAGMSQESGVPTFRDAQTGLWAQFDPTELATEAAFRRHPARVFGWYLWRRHLIKQAKPHLGYRALVQLEDVFDELLVVTQNVDGLHRSSGSSDIVELHGSLGAFRCLDRGHPFDPRLVDELEVREPREIDPPACPRCASLIRPAVVWFGELLPAAAIERAGKAAAGCDAMLVVGTSALVHPAAGLPWTTLERGGIVIEINPDPTPLSDRASVTWRVGAGTALPALVDRLTGGRATR